MNGKARKIVATEAQMSFVLLHRGLFIVYIIHVIFVTRCCKAWH